jgi:hypothetical protein
MDFRYCEQDRSKVHLEYHSPQSFGSVLPRKPARHHEMVLTLVDISFFVTVSAWGEMAVPVSHAILVCQY